MKYKNLLFDVDDTLLDFQDAQKVALKFLFESMDIPYNEETEKMYNTMNQSRWRQFEQGILTSEQVVNGRFGIFFNQLGIEVDSVEMERNYRQYLKEGIKPVEN
ncbi:MAG: HAD family hydrolase, partial [Aerococcus urinaeequi]